MRKDGALVGSLLVNFAAVWLKHLVSCFLFLTHRLCLLVIALISGVSGQLSRRVRAQGLDLDLDEGRRP